MRAIIGSDNHIRPDLPRCRIDEDWETTQANAFIELAEIANKYECPLIIVGDLFDSGNVPARLINMLIQIFTQVEKGVYILAGNHDLPYHSMENIKNSSIGIFRSLAKGHTKITFGMSKFGEWNNFGGKVIGQVNTGIKFLHTLVFENIKSIPPNCKGITASDLLNEYPKHSWIFTGDNHKCFHYEKNNKHVINPGCMIRQSVDEKEYQPSVFFVDTDKNIVERIYLNDNVEMVDDNYIKKEHERDERVGAFIEGLRKSKKISLSFIENIKKAIERNKDSLDESIINMINVLVEGDL